MLVRPMSIGTTSSIRIGAPEHGSTKTHTRHILCAIYRELNATTNTTFTAALPQTCWAVKAKKGSLIIT